MSLIRRITVLLALLDLAALVLVFNLAVAGYLHRTYEHGIVFLPLLAPFAMLVVAIYLIDGYKSRTDMISVDYTSQHILALGSTLIATLLLTYAIIPGGYPL